MMSLMVRDDELCRIGRNAFALDSVLTTVMLVVTDVLRSGAWPVDATKHSVAAAGEWL